MWNTEHLAFHTEMIQILRQTWGKQRTLSLRGSKNSQQIKDDLRPFRQIKYYASQITTMLVSATSAVVSGYCEIILLKENQNQIKQRNKQADPFLTNCFCHLMAYRIWKKTVFYKLALFVICIILRDNSVMLCCLLVFILTPSNASVVIKFNCLEEGINRRSHTGVIDFVDQLPR